MYSTTENFREGFKTLTPELQKSVKESVDFFIKEYKNKRTDQNHKEIAYTFMKLLQEQVDKDVKSQNKTDKPITCGKGCSFCCKINVDITEDEAELLAQYVIEDNIEIDLDKLEKQAKTDHNNLSYKDKSCVFLKDDCCSAYEFRPMNCRRHLVINDPKECDTESNPSGKVGKLMSFKSEILTVAAMTACRTDSLPKLLHEKLCKK